MNGDGNGWIRCGQGHRPWGVNGAAGLLLRHPGPGGVTRVLMQHRAAWTSDGDTWGIPGGARDSHETSVQAALREAGEEAGIESGQCRCWANSSTTTVVGPTSPLSGTGDRSLTVLANAESAELRWVTEDEVEGLALHPGFARSWPAVRSLHASVAGGEAEP